MLNQKHQESVKRALISLLIYVPIVWALLELAAYYLDRSNTSGSYIEILITLSFFGLVAVVIRSWFVDMPGKRFTKTEFALLGSNLILCLIIFQLLFSGSGRDWNKGILVVRQPQTIRIGMLGVTRVSGQTLQENLLGAMQKSLMSGISYIDGLKVIDASYIDLEPGKGLQQLADPKLKEQLEIHYVVSMTVLPRNNGDRFRLLINLLDIDDLKIEWSGQYDTDFDSFFPTVNKITIELGENFGRNSNYKPITLNGNAVKPFLKGMYNYRQFSLESRYEASRFFQESFLNDTSNILPLVYRAINDLNLIFYGYSPQEDRVNGIRHIISSAESQNIPEAFTARALLDLFFQYDWESAEKNLVRSMNMAPQDYVNYFELGIIQGLQGKWDRSIQTFTKYREEDPLNEMYRLGLSVSYLHQGLIDSAYYFYTQYHQAKTSEDPEAMRFPLILEYYLGNKSSGEIHCDFSNGDLVCAWLAGKNETPIEILEENIRNIKSRNGFHSIPEEMIMASYHSGAGNFQASKEYLNIALENRSPFMVFLKLGLFPWLEGDAEGQKILSQMGLAS